jgi:hypothetical protein
MKSGEAGKIKDVATTLTNDVIPNTIIKELSLRYCLDKRVITTIVKHPFIFWRSRIAADDFRALRLFGLGVFYIRREIWLSEICYRQVDKIMGILHSTKLTVDVTKLGYADNEELITAATALAKARKLYTLHKLASSLSGIICKPKAGI